MQNNINLLCKIDLFSQNTPQAPYLQNSKYPDKTSKSNQKKKDIFVHQISFAFPIQVIPTFLKITFVLKWWKSDSSNM